MPSHASSKRKGKKEIMSFYRVMNFFKRQLKSMRVAEKMFRWVRPKCGPSATVR